VANLKNDPQTSEAENQLLKRLGECVTLFNNLNRSQQALVQRVLLAVITGMEMDMNFFGDSLEEIRAFPQKNHLCDYLLYIGGEPGRFWTDACLECFPHLKIKDQDLWRNRGVEFGMGLQMVNILRDIQADFRRGRCYISQDYLSEAGLTLDDLTQASNNEVFLTLYHELIDMTLDYLRNGILYLQEIPRWNWRLRAAVWWPLMIGLRTLELLRMEPAPLKNQNPVKVKRWEIYEFLLESVLSLFSNRLVKWRFEGRFQAASSSAGFRQ
jgi:farnesyl-diphosphate farnesyltransferase